jgi:hypothetical protein
MQYPATASSRPWRRFFFPFILARADRRSDGGLPGAAEGCEIQRVQGGILLSPAVQWSSPDLALRWSALTASAEIGLPHLATA